MVTLTNYDLARIMHDLLVIAKVAMPGHLYQQDPRVHAGQKLLDQLNASQHRPPSELRELLGNVPHIGSADADDPWAQRLDKILNAFPEPDVEVSKGIDAFLADIGSPATRPAAIEHILRDWLIGHGYIQHLTAKDPYH